MVSVTAYCSNLNGNGKKDIWRETNNCRWHCFARSVYDSQKVERKCEALTWHNMGWYLLLSN